MKPKSITIMGPFCPNKFRGMDIAGFDPEPESKPEPETELDPETEEEDE